MIWKYWQIMGIKNKITFGANTSGGRNCISGRNISSWRQSFGLKICPQKRGRNIRPLFWGRNFEDRFFLRTKCWGQIALEDEMVRGRNNQDEMNVLIGWLPLQTKLQTASPKQNRWGRQYFNKKHTSYLKGALPRLACYPFSSAYQTKNF